MKGFKGFVYTNPSMEKNPIPLSYHDSSIETRCGRGA